MTRPQATYTLFRIFFWDFLGSLDLITPKRKPDRVPRDPFGDSSVLVKRNNEKNDNVKNRPAADEKCTILSQFPPLLGKNATPNAKRHARYPATSSIVS